MADIHVQETSTTSQTVLPRVKPSPKNSKVPGQFFYAPSDDGTDENLLILLHGLGTLVRQLPTFGSGCEKLMVFVTSPGDTHIPFSKLGKSLKLPQTAVLALRAPEQ